MTKRAIPRPKVHRWGWTLIELLTTVTVLVIVSVVVVPYATSGNSSIGQSVTRVVVSDILATQMDAIANQGYRRIYFYEDGRGWCVEVLESDQLDSSFNPETAQYVEDVVESQGQQQHAIVDFGSDDRFRNMHIESTQFDGAYSSIIFDPTGGIVAPDGSPSTGGSFEVHSGEFAWEVRLAPLTGKVVIIDLGGGN